MTSADCYTVDVNHNAVLAIGREYEGEKMLGIFNFSGADVTIDLGGSADSYADMIIGQELKSEGEATELTVKGNSFFWLKRG